MMQTIRLATKMLQWVTMILLPLVILSSMSLILDTPSTNKHACKLANNASMIDGCISMMLKIFIVYKMWLLMSWKKLIGTLSNILIVDLNVYFT
jgi:hypothetical protein